MTKSFSVNLPIVLSLPIDKDLKRYFLKKFDRMVACNGMEFGTSTVKSLRELLMQYRADPNRRSNFLLYWSRAPFRKDWRLGKLFGYMDSHPHAVLAFLKFYLGDQPLVEDVEQSSLKHHQLLDSTCSEVQHFDLTSSWIKLLFSTNRERLDRYYVAKSDPDDLYHKFVSFHSLNDWRGYWSKWRRVLVHVETESYDRHSLQSYSTSLVPNPTFYSDCGLDGGHYKSSQYRIDSERFETMLSMTQMFNRPDLPSYGVLDWIRRNLPLDHDLRSPPIFDLRGFRGRQGSPPVGEIHHIPKPGTNVRRPIAVPNRYLQFGMAPYQGFLYSILRNVDRDHTFRQQKSIRFVQNRLDNGHYTCSIDLSKATDLFPKFIFDEYMDKLMSSKPVCGDLVLSKVLFDQVCRLNWINGGNLSSWKVGQPLGTLPSFGVLALGHHILLESIALSEGYGHSPYVVLGDDVLLFSRRMRQRYIESASYLCMPISWHKSHEHNLVEFAGLVHIRNQTPRYIPDPLRITMYNLFDYQRNTGFDISFELLPKDIKKWLSRKAGGLPKGSPLLSGAKLFRLATELYSAVYGSPRLSYMELTMGLIPSFVESLKERVSPDPEFYSGWVTSPDYPFDRVQYIGHSLKRKSETPQWLKEKFKPATTRAILQSTLAALGNQPAH